MSSSTSPINSLSSYSGTYFNGLSTYAQDLNSAIARALQIASLPIQLLQNNIVTLNGQSAELQTLSTDFTAVQSALATLSSAASNTLSASVSQSSVANATLGAGATPGSYSLQVTNLGSYSNALSLDGLPTVTDPTTQSISTSHSYTLTVNGQTIQTPIVPADGSLNALAEAINNAGAGVQATVINVGSDTAPEYRLSLQSDQYGNVSMQLNDGSQDLVAASGDPGQPVQYILNGKQVTSGSRTVTVAQGLTLNLTGTNAGSSATVSVAPDASGIGNALSGFVLAYNTAMSDLNHNRGQAGGALAGQSIVYELTDALQGIPNYSTPGGGIASLAAVGLKFDDTTGQLSYDPSAFSAATSGSLDALNAFLGSATSGGFLQMATNTLTGLLDPSSGILPQDISTTQSSIDNTDAQITSEQDQVAQLQTTLTQQMSAADALIYSMQQQATYYQSMFTAQQDAEIAGHA